MAILYTKVDQGVRRIVGTGTPQSNGLVGEIGDTYIDKTQGVSYTFTSSGAAQNGAWGNTGSVKQITVEKILDLSTYFVPTKDVFAIVDVLTTVHPSYGSGINGALKDDILKFTLSTGLWSIHMTAASIRAAYESGEFHVFNDENGYDYFYDKKNLGWKISNEAKKPSKLVTVDATNGVDRVNYGSRHLPQKTLSYAINLLDNSGWRVEGLAGTYQTAGDTLSINKLNFALTTVGTVGGNTFCQGTANITATGSSTVGIAGWSFQNFVHSGTANAYMHNGFVTISFTKSSNSYFESINTDMGGATTINVTGGGTTVFLGGKTGVMVINNAGALVGVNGTISSFNITLQNGILNLNNCTVYSLSNSAFALTTSANTIVKANNVYFKNLNGTDAKLSINGQWILNNCEFDKDNSVFGANSAPLNGETKIDQLSVNAGVKSQWINVTYSSSFKVPFPAGVVVYNTDGFYMSNGVVPVGTTWAVGTTAGTATWKKIADVGGGSGTTTKLMKHEVKGYVDVSAAFEPNFDGKYVIKNKSTINNTVFPTLSTANDDDVWELAAAAWTRALDITTITENGETQVFFDGDDSPRYYSLTGGWKLFYPYEYEYVTVTGSVMPYFGGNRTFENGSPVFRQSSIGTVTLPASPTTINDDGYQEIESVVEADRCVVLTRKTGNALEFKSGTINPDGTITFGTATSLGVAFNARIFKSPTGGIVVVQGIGDETRELSVKLYVWDNTDYVQAGSAVTYDTGGAGINSFDGCMNANNTLELIYNIEGGACKIACVFVGANSLTKYTEEQLSSSHVLSLGFFSFGVSGRSVLFYKNAGILTAKGYNRSTNGSRTFDATQIPLPTQYNNHDFLRASARNGDMLLTYQYNNQTYCRWLNGNSTQFTITSESLVYNSHLFLVPVLGASSTVGSTLLKTAADTRPQAMGFVKNGDSISLAFPSTTIGSKAVFEPTNGANIHFDNVKFIYTFAASTSFVLGTQAGVLTYDALPEVVSDFVFLDAAVDGGVSRIARNNQVVKNFPNVENGQIYYFNAGLITTTPTKIVAGLGGVDGLILGIVDNTELYALTAVVSNHTDNLAGKGVQLADHGNRITALENNSGVKVGWRFPDFSIGWGMAMIYNDGIRDNVIGGGSNNQTRGFGDLENDGLVTQHHIDFNGNIADENAFTGFDEIRYNSRNGIARSKEGKLFMFGRDNQYGQLGDGTTVGVSPNGRAGKWILQTQPEVYGANLFVTKVDISEDWWGDDSSRCTLLATVRNTSTNVFNGYMRGFSSNSTGDAWCIISSNNPSSGGGVGSTPVKGSVLPWTKIFANPANIVGASLSVHQAHIIVDEGTNKRLLFSGLNQTGCSGNGAALDFAYSSYQQCIYEDGSHVLDAKWVKNVYSNIAANTVFMINTAGKPFSCGYQGNYNSGFGTTANEFRFKAMLTTFIANRQVTKMLVFRNAFAALLDNDDLIYGGYSQNYTGTNGTSNFKNGVNTDIVNGNPVVLNSSYQTPILMAQGIDKIWSNGTRGQFGDDFIYLRRRASKDVLITGYVLNNTSLADNTNNNATNYARVIHKPSAGEWIEDLHVDGGKTDAGAWLFATTIITNKGNVYRAGWDDTLTGRASTVNRILVKWKRVFTEYETK